MKVKTATKSLSVTEDVHSKERRQKTRKTRAEKSIVYVSESSLQKKKEAFLKKNLPFFYIKNENNKKNFLFHSQKIDLSVWRSSRYWNQYHPHFFKEIESSSFYVALPENKSPVFLGAWKSFVDNRLNENLPVYRALMSSRSQKISDHSLVDLASLFSSGLFAPVNQIFAQSLVDRIEHPAEKSMSLNNALVTSVYSTQISITEALLSLGASPNSHDYNGSYALTSAVFKGNSDAIDLLLKSGADENIVDPVLGESAKELLESSEQSD